MRNELVINGSKMFMGLHMPVVLGGFGTNKKCMSDKTIAEIHQKEIRHVRELINRNITRFDNKVDYIDLKAVVLNDSYFLSELGYSNQQIIQAEHIYLLSERGYSKIIKIMDTDLAWEIHDKIMDEYFQLREEKMQDKPKKKNLSSTNMMIKTVSDIFRNAGVDPIFIAAEAKRLYKEEADIDIQIPLITDASMPKLYDCTEMAKELGILSGTGKPHNQAISAIIGKLSIEESEIITTAFCRNGHDDVTTQYKPSVIDKVKQWLSDNNYPDKIPYVDSKGNYKTYKVSYQQVEVA